jgi:hypothetical protein
MCYNYIANKKTRRFYMRVATKVIVILGALIAIGLGIYWEIDYGQTVQLLAETKSSSGIDLGSELSNELGARQMGGYALIAGGVVSFVAVLLINKLKKISAALILASVVVAAILNPLSLVGTFLLIVGGIMAFFVKPKEDSPNTQVA